MKKYLLSIKLLLWCFVLYVVLGVGSPWAVWTYC